MILDDLIMIEVYISNRTMSFYPIVALLQLSPIANRWSPCYNVKIGIILTPLTYRSYFWALQSFKMFTGPLFQVKLYFLSTVLLSYVQRMTAPSYDIFLITGGEI